MKVVDPIGGPMCGQRVAVQDGAFEFRVAMQRGTWRDVLRNPGDHVDVRVGAYTPQTARDAALNRWTWKEPQ